MSRKYSELFLRNNSIREFSNTIATFGTKLDTPLEVKPNTWEVGQVEISPPKCYKEIFLQNTISLNSEEIIFQVKHLESVFDFSQIYNIFRNRLKRKTLLVYTAIA